MWARVKCLALALVFVFSVVMASCSKPESKEENPVNTENTEITDGADEDDIVVSAEKTTLTIYATYIPKKEYERLRRVSDEIEKSLSKTLNLRFDIRSIWDILEVRRELGKKNIIIREYDDYISTEAEIAMFEEFMKLEQPFDLLIFPVISSHIDIVGEKQLIEKYIIEGRFMDITDLLPSYAPHYFSAFSQEELESVTYNKRLYGIPYGKAGFRPLIAVTSKKLMEKYGIEKIETIEDLSKYTNMVEKEDAKFYPLEYNPSEEFWEFIAARDGYVLCDGYMVYRRDDPEMKLIPFEETDTFKYGALFLNKYPMISIIEKQLKAASYIRRYVWDDLPLFEGDSWVHWPLYRGAHLNNIPIGMGYYISSQSQHAKEVLQFIEWLNSSPENYLLIYYGFEGTDYTIENGEIVPKGDPQDRSKNRFFLPFKSEIGELYTKSGPSEFDSYYTSSFPPHNGFNPSLDLRAELARRNKAFWDMKISKLFYGSLDINEFIEEMKSLGTQSILEKYQSELDEWRKNR